MVTSFDMETPFYGEGDHWATLTVSADITAYGADDVLITDEAGLELDYQSIPSELRTQVDLKLMNLVLDARVWERRLTRLELTDERT